MSPESLHNLNGPHCTKRNRPQVLGLSLSDPGIEDHYQYYQHPEKTGFFGCHTGWMTWTLWVPCSWKQWNWKERRLRRQLDKNISYGRWNSTVMLVCTPHHVHVYLYLCICAAKGMKFNYLSPPFHHTNVLTWVKASCIKNQYWHLRKTQDFFIHFCVVSPLLIF